MRIFFQLSLALLTVLLVGACSSSGKKGDLPKNLPSISLATSSATPPHNLPSYEYPFDSSGNYVSDWAAEGERRSGRSAANDSDTQRWSSSHGGSATARKPKVTTVSKSKSSASKSKTTASKSKAKPAAGGSRSHTVKKGDTLYGLALRYGTTVAKIKSANGMSSDMLKIGRVLKIPR